LTEEYLSLHPEAEMFTYKTYIELAAQAGRLQQGKNFILKQAKKHEEFPDLTKIAELINEDEKIANGGN